MLQYCPVKRIVSAKLHDILFDTTCCSFSCIIADIFELLFSVKSMAGDSKDPSFLKRALRGVRAVICVNVCISTLSVLYNMQFYFFVIIMIISICLTQNVYPKCRTLWLIFVFLCMQEGFLSNVESWKGLEHVILLSQVLIPYPPGANNSEEIVV